MAAIAFGLLWASYTAGLYGYCLIRGYDITPKQLLSFEWPPGSGNKKKGPVEQAAGDAAQSAKDYANQNNPNAPKYVPNPQGRIP